MNVKQLLQMFAALTQKRIETARENTHYTAENLKKYGDVWQDAHTKNLQQVEMLETRFADIQRALDTL